MRRSGLNPSQLSAVTHKGGPLLILAGAGTGKTRVITHRIAHLIGSGVPAGEILALSFTNKAAREVADRVRELAGDAADGAVMSTFHSLGLSILKQEGWRIGLGQGFTLVSEGERKSALRQMVRETAPGLDPSEAGDAISRWKNRGMTAREAREAKEPVVRALIDLFALYESFMHAQRAVDFDDLLLLPLRIMTISDDARATWGGRFSHIMVDEYQDTNLVQFKLLKLLDGGRGHIAVVGDDDQAIYGWRGAEVELILRFPDHFPGCRTIVLEENYRSTAVILDAAHSVVEKLVSRHRKKLKVASPSGRAAPDPVYILEAEDEDSEAEEIASAILAERFGSRRPWSHFAVLYRVNGQSRAFEQVFRSHDIPHEVFGGNRFFDHKEVRDVLSYLKLLQNPRDDSALMRIANVPRRGLGHQTMINLRNRAAETGSSLLDSLAEGEILSPQAKGGAKALLEILKEFRGRFSSEGLTPEGLEDLIGRLNLKDDVRANYESARAVQKRIEMLDALPGTVASCAKGRKGVPLSEFIETITLDPPADREGEESDSVKLMTLHSAKGLEFPFVYLAGLEEGLLPFLSRDADPAREEEERRLCYVGMTRAKSRLTLSRARTRKRNGSVRGAEPSRFLMEIPSAVKDQALAANQKTEEKSREEAAAFFENIRKILDSR